MRGFSLRTAECRKPRYRYIISCLLLVCFFAFPKVTPTGNLIGKFYKGIEARYMAHRHVLSPLFKEPLLVRKT